MISRRVFLKDGGLALLSVGLAPRFLLRTAAAGRGRRKVLVVIFQRGAGDGLNMVVPFAERDYYFARPSIALARPGAGEGAALDLDGFFGLHPRLGPLHRLYEDGHLAIVHACGSPDSTRSHFDAQDYMETGTPGVKRTGDGWLNRYLAAGPQSQDHTPFRGVAMTEMLPRSLLGAVPTLAIPDLRRFGLHGGGAAGASGEFRSALETEYAAAADPRLNTAGRDAFEALRMLESVRPGAEPANGAVYPTSAYGRTLQQIAQLIKADVGLEVAFAESTGWDHHVNEGAANRPARGSPGRLWPRHCGARHRPGRPHGGCAGPDDVGVRPGGRREWQSRYRPWTRQRDVPRGRDRERRPGLRPLARSCPRAAIRGA